MKGSNKALIKRAYLSANQEAGCHSQAMSEIIYGVGQKIEVSTDLQRGKKRKKPSNTEDYMHRISPLRLQS